MKRLLFVTTTLVAALLVAPAAFAAKEEKVTKVTLLGINDFHGHLEAGTPGR